MSKTLKMGILLVIITLGFLFLGTEVKAVEVNSEAALLEAIDTQYQTITDTNITLTADIETGVVDLGEFDWVLDLNGHTLTTGEFYVNDNSLTINDSKGNGKLETTTDWFWVEDGAKLILNNGKIDYLINGGTTIINNGTVDMITNEKILTIEDGTFGGMWQRGTEATIKGGTFTATTATSAIDLTAGTTVISGKVEFKRTNENNALMINSANSIDSGIINQIVEEGYIATYSGYSTNNDSWYDEELGETIYHYEVIYEPVKVIEDETDEILNKVAPNGVWTVNGAKPKDMEESDFLLSSIVGEMEQPEGYEVMAWAMPADEFDPENVELSIYYNGSYLKSKTVKAVYNEPSEAITSKVDSILNKIAEKIGEEADVDTGFRVEDLYLINYLNTSSKGINGSLALNFSKDLIALTNGGNISYRYNSRKGAFTPTGLWSFTGGRVIVYHDGVGVGTTEIGLTTNHVLYVPSTTANSDEARIDAALKRIEEYLGSTSGITIEVGGTLESLNKDGFTWKDYEFIDDKTSGSNYYNVTIKGETYKFAICKKDSDKLETPKYVGTDVISKISVTSDDKTIPLDTAVSVKEVETDALGTDAYAAYDITLYSNAKETKVTKLTNGKFVVSIPVPEKLKNIENLTVYYIDNNGNKEDYNATVKDGIATFETSHFSTYAIAEKEQKVEIYSLTLDANEGKFADGKDKLVFEDVTKCDMTKVEKPVKDGYTFKGWYTEKTGGKSIETVMNSEDGIKEDMTFYAQWEEIKTDDKEDDNKEEENTNTNTGNTDSGNTNTGNTNTDKPTANNPQTGDNIVMFTVISLIAFAGIAFVIKVKKYVK